MQLTELVLPKQSSSPNSAGTAGVEEDANAGSQFGDALLELEGQQPKVGPQVDPEIQVHDGNLLQTSAPTAKAQEPEIESADVLVVEQSEIEHADPVPLAKTLFNGQSVERPEDPSHAPSELGSGNEAVLDSGLNVSKHRSDSSDDEAKTTQRAAEQAETTSSGISLPISDMETEGVADPTVPNEKPAAKAEVATDTIIARTSEVNTAAVASASANASSSLVYTAPKVIPIASSGNQTSTPDRNREPLLTIKRPANAPEAFPTRAEPISLPSVQNTEPDLLSDAQLLPRVHPAPSEANQAQTSNLAQTQGGASIGSGAPQAVSQQPAPQTTFQPYNTSMVDRTILPQVVGSVQTAGSRGIIDVLLDPPELGRIEIVLEMAEQGLRATLTAERGTTAEMLRRHSDALSQQFAEAGFEDVDLEFADGHGSTDSNSDNTGTSTQVNVLAELEETVRTSTAKTVGRMPNGLDLKL